MPQSVFPKRHCLLVSSACSGQTTYALWGSGNDVAAHWFARNIPFMAAPPRNGCGGNTRGRRISVFIAVADELLPTAAAGEAVRHEPALLFHQA